jgi:hypothetical protein
VGAVDFVLFSLARRDSLEVSRKWEILVGEYSKD